MEEITTQKRLVLTIQELITKGEKADASAEEYYKAAGERLAQLKKQLPRGTNWADYVKTEVGISRERADQLIRLSNGTAHLQIVREKNAAANKKFREKKPQGEQVPVSRDAEPEDLVKSALDLVSHMDEVERKHFFQECRNLGYLPVAGRRPSKHHLTAGEMLAA